jgi:hypothetical protein
MFSIAALAGTAAASAAVAAKQCAGASPVAADASANTGLTTAAASSAGSSAMVAAMAVHGMHCWSGGIPTHAAATPVQDAAKQFTQSSRKVVK